ncbi:MAG TPA: hypothetical protein VGC41_02410 [Kofleriaceae bacterium]
MKVLIAVASLLVIGGVALVLILSGSDPDKVPPTPRKVAMADRGTPVETSPSSPVVTPTPSLPGGPDGTGSDHVTEYMVGDVKIRDHRRGSNAPMDIPPNSHPSNARELPLELTHDITNQVNKAILGCSTTVPKEARGDKPKVIGQLVVSVKNRQLSVTGLTLETRDISDAAAADALKQCAQEKSASMTANAHDVDDILNYKIQLNYAIP